MICVYKTKLNEKGEVKKFNAGFEAKGSSHQPRIDFGGYFTLVARLDIVEEVLGKTTQNKWTNVKSTF